jgi:hypothetical protein
MNETKVICPITKDEFPNTCLTCNFCIKENGERVGCAIRKQVRMFFDQKEIGKEINFSFNDFKDKIHESIQNTQDIIKYGGR